MLRRISYKITFNFNYEQSKLLYGLRRQNIFAVECDVFKEKSSKEERIKRKKNTINS